MSLLRIEGSLSSSVKVATLMADEVVLLVMPRNVPEKLERLGSCLPELSGAPSLYQFGGVWVSTLPV